MSLPWLVACVTGESPLLLWLPPLSLQGILIDHRWDENDSGRSFLRQWRDRSEPHPQAIPCFISLQSQTALIFQVPQMPVSLLVLCRA